MKRLFLATIIALFGLSLSSGCILKKDVVPAPKIEQNTSVDTLKKAWDSDNLAAQQQYATILGRGTIIKAVDFTITKDNDIGVVTAEVFVKKVFAGKIYLIYVRPGGNWSLNYIINRPAEKEVK